MLKRLLDQDVYNKEFNKFSEKFENVKQKVLELEKQKAAQITKRCQIETFLKKISKTETFLEEFDEELWFAFVKHIKIGNNGSTTVIFKNGTEI